MDDMLMDNPVRKFREERGLSRSDVCRQSGISYTTLGNIEQGLVLDITLETREKLLAFGYPDTIDMDYLKWKEEMEISMGNKTADIIRNKIAYRRRLMDQ